MNSNVMLKRGQTLRCGYTTGSCATAAATAATQMLLSNKETDSVLIKLANGENVVFSINDIDIKQNEVTCSVTKDAGDDPDVTDGMKIFAKCLLTNNGITLKGGIGIGTIQSKGLKFPVGDPAINEVPRKMIKENTAFICDKFNYKKGIEITIFAPEGEKIAQKTFNPRLGIVGGISILGTTGVVEPMSEKALIDTIKIFIDKQKSFDNENILVSPGNYGRDYCRKVLGLDIDNAIKCSNYIGETLDYLRFSKYKKILLVGHIGKLVKIAGGIMNTHSSMADCRAEIFAAHTALLDSNQKLIKSIMNSLTTDEIIEHLEENNICEDVFKSILEKIQFHLNYRVKDEIKIEVVLFTSKHKKVFKSRNADNFIEIFRSNNLEVQV